MRYTGIKLLVLDISLIIIKPTSQVTSTVTQNLGCSRLRKTLINFITYLFRAMAVDFSQVAALPKERCLCQISSNATGQS